MTDIREATPPLDQVVVRGHPAPGSFKQAVAERYCRTAREDGQEANERAHQ